jgi:hypothetical protein
MHAHTHSRPARGCLTDLRETGGSLAKWHLSLTSPLRLYHTAEREKERERKTERESKTRERESQKAQMSENQPKLNSKSIFTS